MLEKFTEEEIEQIKKELVQMEAEKQEKEKPHHLSEYVDSINEMFKDRPYHEKSRTNYPDVATYLGRAMDTIVSMTLDCTEIKDEKREYNRNGTHYECHSMHIKKTPRVPVDVADEYYEMFDEILDLMKGHLKPYKRFLEED